MNMAARRQIALGAARSYLRGQGYDPATLPPLSAWIALDALHRADPDTVAAQFYWTASDAQYKLFKQEWNRWRNAQR